MKASRGHEENPYVGLRPFESADSLYFFGRDRQVKELLPRLETSRFLAVVGGSGCGKSSLIRAGLIPVLEAGFLVESRDAWLIASMRPGDRARRRLGGAVLRLAGAKPTAAELDDFNNEIRDDGLEALVRRIEPLLADRRTNLLLLVDQFEELFHADRRDGLVRPTDESRDFVSLLLDLAADGRLAAYVVMTMRSDFLGDCALFAGLPEAMNRSQYLVPRLDFAQRQEAIVGPPGLLGARISAVLLDRVGSEQLETHDDLPVLQHALRRTWAEWQRRGGDGEIGLDDYLRIGTVHQALNQDAEEALDVAHRTGEELEITRRFFQALTFTDAANRRVRWPTRLSALAAITGASEARLREVVVERFAAPDRSFLVVPEEDDPLIDLSHESLIRQWKRLTGWVDAEAKSAADYRRLLDVTMRHQAGEADLYPPADVAVTTRWREAQRPNEAWAARYEAPSIPGQTHLRDALAFLAASAHAHRLRRMLGIVVVLGTILTLSVLAAYAFSQRTRALGEATRAERARRKAETNALDLANALNREKQMAQATNEQAALRIALITQLQKVTNELERANADLVAKNDDLVRVRGTLTNKVEELQQETKRADLSAKAERNAKSQTTVALFESYVHGATLLSRNSSFAAAVLALDKSRELERSVTPQRMPPERVSTRNLLQWYAQRMSRTAAQVQFLAGVALRDVEVSRDARWLVVGGEQGRAALFDLERSQWVTNWQAHDLTVRAIAMDPESRWILTGSEDHRILRWSLPDAHPVEPSGWRLASAVDALVICPDGRWLAAAGRNDVVALWLAEDPAAAPVFEAEIEGLSCLAFSADSRWLAAGAATGLATVWDPTTVRPTGRRSGRPAALIHFQGDVRQLAFRSGRGELAAGCADGSIQIRDIAEDRLVRTLGGHQGAVHGLVFTHVDGRELLISGGADLVLRVWNVETGNLVAVLEGHTAGITGVAAAGTHCFSASNDGSWRDWPLAVMPGSRVLTDVPERPASCALAPDGMALAIGGERGEVRVINLAESRKAWRNEREHRGRVSRLAFSPDGRWLVSAGFDGRVHLWDARDGQPRGELARQAGAIHAIAFSPDGRWLAAGGAGSEAQLSSPPPAVTHPVFTGEVDLVEFGTDRVRRAPVSSGAVYSVAFDPGSTRLLTAGEDGRLRWWWVTDFPAESHELGPTNGAALGWAAFRPGPGTNWIATAGRDGIVHLMDLDEGGREVRLTGHEDTIVRVEFGADGGQALTASADGVLRAWDLGLSEPSELFALRLDTPRRRGAVLDFAYLPQSSGKARLAVPLTTGEVVLYDLGAIYP